MDINNPAALLQHWLGLADRTHSGNSMAYSVWLTVWELEDDVAGNRELVNRAWDLISNAAAVRTRASALPAGDILLSQFGEVEGVLSQFLNVRSIKRHEFFGPMRATGWVCLEQLAVLLDRDDIPVVEVEEAAVESLLDEVRKLIDMALEDQQLDPDLRRDVVDRLLDVERRILRVEVGGGEEVSKAIDGLSGVMVRMGLRNRAFLAHPLVDSMWRLCGGLALLVGMASDFHQLAAGGAAALLALPPGDTGGEGGGGSH